MTDQQPETPKPPPHKRRVRYTGRNPRRFEEKYKEHAADRHQETVAKVVASGKTPAGTHRPIMVAEILEVLAPKPGEMAVDCTLGYGGHALEILQRITPGGKLLGLDADPIELVRTEARLREKGYGPDTLVTQRMNFAGVAKGLMQAGMEGADIILADLGLSSMQIDNPARGFSVKHAGPLDMRMNPERGATAASFLAKVSAKNLEQVLVENADEPHAARLAEALAGQRFATTLELAHAVRRTVPSAKAEDADLSVRRVFQAIRVAVNDEFSALENLLRNLPSALKPGGRVAILTFHSGEDRRVKKAFELGLRAGQYSAIAPEVVRAEEGERRANPRSISAKLRWAIKGPALSVSPA